MTGTDRARGPLGRVAVIIPTYNERGNVEQITTRLRAAVPDAELLVVDDNSPDGTGDIADKLAASDPAIHVLHRPGKAGLGAAYIAGFGWALEHGFGVLVEFDADGSHQPAELPRLLDRSGGRRPGHRLPLGARRRPCRTGRSPGRSCPAAATSTSG